MLLKVGHSALLTPVWITLPELFLPSSLAFSTSKACNFLWAFHLAQPLRPLLFFSSCAHRLGFLSNHSPPTAEMVLLPGFPSTLPALASLLLLLGFFANHYFALWPFFPFIDYTFRNKTAAIWSSRCSSIWTIYAHDLDKNQIEKNQSRTSKILICFFNPRLIFFNPRLVPLFNPKKPLWKAYQSPSWIDFFQSQDPQGTRHDERIFLNKDVFLPRKFNTEDEYGRVVLNTVRGGKKNAIFREGKWDHERKSLIQRNSLIEREEFDWKGRIKFQKSLVKKEELYQKKNCWKESLKGRTE